MAKPSEGAKIAAESAARARKSLSSVKKRSVWDQPWRGQDVVGMAKKSFDQVMEIDKAVGEAHEGIKQYMYDTHNSINVLAQLAPDALGKEGVESPAEKKHRELMDGEKAFIKQHHDALGETITEAVGELLRHKKIINDTKDQMYAMHSDLKTDDAMANKLEQSIEELNKQRVALNDRINGLIKLSREYDVLGDRLVSPEEDLIVGSAKPDIPPGLGVMQMGAVAGGELSDKLLEKSVLEARPGESLGGAFHITEEDARKGIKRDIAKEQQYIEGEAEKIAKNPVLFMRLAKMIGEEAG